LPQVYLLMRFTKEQSDIIMSKDKRILLLAAAGSGKTTTVTQRVITRVMQKQVAPKNLLFLSFSRTASSEVRDRIRKSLPQYSHEIRISTFHALAYHHLVDLGYSIQILHTNQYLKAIREFVRNYNEDGGRIDETHLIDLILEGLTIG
jgi:DNA helicase-2/ATP-dependent DNA helicase PcrA